MGWYGDWNIQYKGENKAKFEKLAKLIIPNYKERFEFDEESGMLNCTRALSWYYADEDLKEILSYLDDGDEIISYIDGETHPCVRRKTAEENNLSYSESRFYNNGIVELEQEVVSLKKSNGKVSLQNKYPDKDRYKTKMLGNVDNIEWPLKNGRAKELQEAFTDWANAVGDDEEICKIAQKHLKKVLANEKLREYVDSPIKGTEIARFVQALEDTTTLAEFLREYQTEEAQNSKESEKETNPAVEGLLKQLGTKNVLRLGGKEIVEKLVEAKGVEEATTIFRTLGYIKSDEYELYDFFL